MKRKFLKMQSDVVHTCTRYFSVHLSAFNLFYLKFKLCNQIKFRSVGNKGSGLFVPLRSRIQNTNPPEFSPSLIMMLGHLKLSWCLIARQKAEKLFHRIDAGNTSEKFKKKSFSRFPLHNSLFSCLPETHEYDAVGYAGRNHES